MGNTSGNVDTLKCLQSIRENSITAYCSPLSSESSEEVQTPTTRCEDKAVLLEMCG